MTEPNTNNQSRDIIVEESSQLLPEFDLENSMEVRSFKKPNSRVKFQRTSKSSRVLPLVKSIDSSKEENPDFLLESLQLMQNNYHKKESSPLLVIDNSEVRKRADLS